MIRHIMLVAALLVTASPAVAQKQKPGVTYDATVLRVIDGDTVAFAAPWLPDPLKKELSIRVFGVDTPEKGHRAQCPSEDARGQEATKFTKDSIAALRSYRLFLWIGTSMAVVC